VQGRSRRLPQPTNQQRKLRLRKKIKKLEGKIGWSKNCAQLVQNEHSHDLNWTYSLQASSECSTRSNKSKPTFEAHYYTVSQAYFALHETLHIFKKC
jgi:hypothetical protein